MILSSLIVPLEVEPVFAKCRAKVVEPGGVLVKLRKERFPHPGRVASLDEITDQQRPVGITQQFEIRQTPG